jgi:hypothetical protein
MTDTRGAAALMMVLVLTAFVIILVGSVMLRGVDDLENGFSEQLSSDVLHSAESCMDEAFIRLSRDNNYTGGTLEVGEASCTIAVSGTPCGTCTVTVDATGEGFTRSLQSVVDVFIADVDIVSWEEI